MTEGDAALGLGLPRSRLRCRSRPHVAASSSGFVSRLQAPAAPCDCESCRPSLGGSRAADGQGAGGACVVVRECTPSWGWWWDGRCRTARSR